MSTTRLALSFSALMLLGCSALAQSSPVPQRPIEYVENRGQWPADVAFRARAGVLTTWATTGGWVLQAEERRDEAVHGVASRMPLGSFAAPRPDLSTRRSGARNTRVGQARTP